MTFLLDTNVLSELERREPEPRVVSWIGKTDDRRLHTSVIVLSELLYGVERRGEIRRGAELRRFVDGLLLTVLSGRILPFDQACARVLARLRAQTEDAGAPRPKTDLMIAATAIAHGYTLVTRNVADFEGLPLALLNPWDA